jgi:peptidase A4-like protein
MKGSTSLVVIALAVVSVLSFTTLAVAQREEAHAILDAAPKIDTSVQGVHAFPSPPAGFNPLTANNRELLTYGLPQRPDPTADARAYQNWERGMLALKTHAVDVRTTPYYSTNAHFIGEPSQNADGTTLHSGPNWSGIANTNKLKSWNDKTSFNEVVSYWPVPAANRPFGGPPCGDGPWFEVTWNGIDGFSNGDVVQGGSASYFDGGGCGGKVQTYGWVEWYPSYSIMPITCGKSDCPVNPGDDFYVITYGAAGTVEQYVFVEDITQQWSGTFGLTYVTGPGVVGSSAEYIVERPGTGIGYFPLGNYVLEFFSDSYAYDGAGTLFYPGSTAASTYILTMLADDGKTPISYVWVYGTSGNAGKYSFTTADENCAYSGGCAN